MSGNEITNEILGRYTDEVRKSHEKITADMSEMKTSVAVIQEQTKLIPKMQKDVDTNSKSILTINVKRKTEEKILELKRKNLRFYMYVGLFAITVSSAYGAAITFFDK